MPDASELGLESLLHAAAQSLTRLSSEALTPGLYLVATPIGNLGDITLRALSVVLRADQVYCEDTRHSRKLLAAYGLQRPLRAYHDHNAERVRPAILGALTEGRSVALLSDAGTPLIADPGYKLTRAAIEEGHRVHPVPGASAALAALTASGLPSDSFFFAGFLPPKSSARQARLAELASAPGSLVFFETANRLEASLEDIRIVLGDREAALLREATKRHEQLVRGPVSTLWGKLAPEQRRGEMALVLAERVSYEITTQDIREHLLRELRGASMRDAVSTVSESLGASRKAVYEIALQIKKKL
jgi:16S rRNA (cytidine1402-2'-O)-methyltransferase